MRIYLLLLLYVLFGNLFDAWALEEQLSAEADFEPYAAWCVEVSA